MMKKVSFLMVVLFSLFLTSCNQKTEKVILLQDYITADMTDIMPAIRSAMEACRNEKATKLVLPEGRFLVKPDFAFERFCFLSNNDEGLKRIAFDLTGLENFAIEGGNTHLDFEGYIVPFLINASNHITISGVSIDYTTPFHSEGEIIQLTDKYVDVRFDEKEFPYRINNGCLYFDNKPTGSNSFNLMLEFDKDKKEPAHYAYDYWIDGTVPSEKLDNGDVRIYREGLKGSVGNIFVFGCSHRKIPGFIISDSKNVLVHDVNVFHSGAMAFIAQRSENIELNKVNVTLPPDKNRIVSATADATHFSNCSGYIRLLDCVFENQKDDATNIHGIYAMIQKIIDPKTIVVQYVHEQQMGFNFIREGQNLEIVNNENLIHCGDCKVASYEVLNKQYTKVTLTENLPDGVCERFVVAQTDGYPDVLMKGCTVRNNRARGILLGSRGKVVIDSNYFHAPGAAILFEGDGSYWYEQSGVRDVEIKGNIFDNCNYGCPGWGSACIAVGSGVRKDKEVSRYHSNIRIHDNTFRYFDPRILNFYCVDGVEFYDNILQKTDAYSYDLDKHNIFVMDCCNNLNIKE